MGDEHIQKKTKIIFLLYFFIKKIQTFFALLFIFLTYFLSGGLKPYIRFTADPRRLKISYTKTFIHHTVPSLSLLSVLPNRRRIHPLFRLVFLNYFKYLLNMMRLCVILLLQNFIDPFVTL